MKDLYSVLFCSVLQVVKERRKHLSMEEETPLRPSVRVPRHPGSKPEASRLLPDRASTPAVERGIGLQSSTSALLPSPAASACEDLPHRLAIAACTPERGDLIHHVRIL